MPKTLTILHLTANPGAMIHVRPADDLEQETVLATDLERKLIERKRMEASLRQHINVISKGAVHAIELVDLLSECPDVLHLSGHGKENGENLRAITIFRGNSTKAFRDIF